MENASYKLLEAAVYRTLHAHGFSRSSSLATFVLSDLFSRYLSLLSTTCTKYAQHAGRRSLSVRDATSTLEELGVSIEELEEYCSLEGKELGRYAIYSARRVEDLNEFRAQLSDGLRQDRGDDIPLFYAPYDPLPEDETDSGEEATENDKVMAPPTKVTSRDFHTQVGHGSLSECIPSYFPPFPTISLDPSTPTFITPQLPQSSIFEPISSTVEKSSVEKQLMNLSQTLTASTSSDYHLQVPYSQSSLSGVTELHLPPAQPPPSQVNSRHIPLPTPNTSHSMNKAYHWILTEMPSTLNPPTLSRHKVAMSLLLQSQTAPRWDPPDSLYSGVDPCVPHGTVVGPTYYKAKDDTKEKEFKFPQTARTVVSSKRLTPLVSHQLSRIPDLSRIVLPPSILSRTSKLSHPPALQSGSETLVYGYGVPAPWNKNVSLPTDPQPQKEKPKDALELVAKPPLPDAEMFVTWPYDRKDFRKPLAPSVRHRGRVVGSTHSGVISLSRPKTNRTTQLK